MVEAQGRYIRDLERRLAGEPVTWLWLDGVLQPKGGQMIDSDDPAEGTGDESAYDGRAVEHLDSDAGQAEASADMTGEDPNDSVVEP